MITLICEVHMNKNIKIKNENLQKHRKRITYKNNPTFMSFNFF